jgi:hypothetical protein
MSSPSITFSVQALNVSVDAAKALLAGVTDTSFDCDVVADLNLPLADAQDLFRFQSDAIDVTNVEADDIKYKVNYTSSNTLDASGIPTEVVSADWLANTLCSGTDFADQVYIDGTAGAAFKGVAFEYTRYLAHNLFNTHLGVDLFSNEEEVRAALDRSARAALDTKMTDLAGLEGGAYITPSQMTGDFSHPSHVILSKIILDAPDRLATLADYAIAGGDESGADPSDPMPTFKMPLAVGDKIQFKLTIQAESTQSDIVDSNAAISNRTYRIVMNVVA